MERTTNEAITGVVDFARNPIGRNSGEFHCKGEKTGHYQP